MELQGTTAIVTGGNGGLGQRICHGLAAAGCNVAVVYAQSKNDAEKVAGEYAEDLAASMLASTLGIDFDPDKAYDERKGLYRMSGKIIRSRSTTQSAVGSKDGKWTCVVAAAVFIK